MDETDFKWWPLPEGVVDTTMNRAELSQYMDVSINTIDAWMKAGLPVFEEGGNGKAYTFMLGDCAKWRHERDETAKTRKLTASSAIEARQRAFLNFGEMDLVGPMSAKERREAALADLDYNRAALQRRELCRMSDVVTLIEDIFLIVREEADALPDRLEREMGLEPAQIDTLVEQMDGMLSSMVMRIEQSQLEGYEDEAIGQPTQVLI
ncbi:MAG: hypothetical protein COA84_15145 [Robiginitomaculum sp.]|nr:MAG: hypothetical protein COA84_15145 [Robiginitomaculum sp.]